MFKLLAITMMILSLSGCSTGRGGEGVKIGPFSVYFGKIAKGCNGETPPWRGYCWGSDWPRLNLQCIVLDQRGAICYCIDISWLCYYSSIYWNRHDHGEGVMPRLIAAIKRFFRQCQCDPYYGEIDPDCEVCWPWKKNKE